MAVDATVAGRAQAGKYLSFLLGEGEYGLEILKVHEIKGMMDVTRVPRAPRYMRGVVNLRGRVIPIISLREKFQLPPVEDDEKTCIIVVQVQHRKRQVAMGIVVDGVAEVLNITPGTLEKAPGSGTGWAGADFITGMGKLDKKTVALLDIDRVLNGADLENFVQQAQ